MNVAYKVIKPFGCAKIGDIFNFDSDDKEFVMEDTKTTKKGTNSRFMSINEEYVDNNEYDILKSNSFTRGHYFKNVL